MPLKALNMPKKVLYSDLAISDENDIGWKNHVDECAMRLGKKGWKKESKKLDHDPFIYGDGDGKNLSDQIVVPTDGRHYLIYSGRGNDNIVGGNNSSHLYGGEGSDDILAGSSGDLLSGGPGKDRLEGGEGEDLFEISRDRKRDTIINFDLKEDEVLIFPEQYDGLMISAKKTGVVIEAPGEGKMLLKGVSFDDFLDAVNKKCLFRWIVKDHRDQIFDNFVN